MASVNHVDTSDFMPFPVIDMHCDTISVIHDSRLEGRETDLFSNSRHIDLRRLKSAGYMCQNFALFTYMGNWKNISCEYQCAAVVKKYTSPREYAIALSDLFDSEMAAHSDIIRPVLNARDIESNYDNGFVSALKTIEEGAVYEGSTDILRDFYDRGVRMTTLTWNFENELAFPNSINLSTGECLPDTEHGLKPAGRDFVEACRELGIIIDISHLNDAGIYDIFDMLSESVPIVASHSNSRALASHPRNLTDDMLKKLGNCGGVAGINFCADFISNRFDNNTLISDVIAHIKYIENVAGIEAEGLGSDFDGIENEMEFKDCQGMQLLAKALSDEGYSSDKIEKIFYRNVLRVYRDVLK